MDQNNELAVPCVSINALHVPIRKRPRAVIRCKLARSLLSGTKDEFAATAPMAA